MKLPKNWTALSWLASVAAVGLHCGADERHDTPFFRTQFSPVRAKEFEQAHALGSKR